MSRAQFQPARAPGFKEIFHQGHCMCHFALLHWFPHVSNRAGERTAIIRQESGQGQCCNTAQRWKLAAPHAHHCQQALMRLQLLSLGLRGGTSDKTCWLQASECASECCVPHGCELLLSFHSGISWVTLTEIWLSCHRVVSCRSISSHVQALQNPCVWEIAHFFSFPILCFAEE